MAQWNEIADFIGPCPGCLSGETGEYVTAILFLGQSGPQQIGFVGTESELFRTTDAGQHWKSVWDSGQSYLDYYVTDICFKDSMTGWFSVINDYGTSGDACYRTTDGGVTWKRLSVPHTLYGAETLCYIPLTKRLLLSVVDTLGDSIWGGTLYSTDDGTTWKILVPLYSDGFSFFNDSIGIASAFDNSNSFESARELMRTTDGGITWERLSLTFSAGTKRGQGYYGCYQPLAIPGSSTCFEVESGEMLIRRSDDYGTTWMVLKDFGPFQDTTDGFLSIAPSSWGAIQGDLSRLYIQTDTGMYVSTDQGVTWFYDGGPTNVGNPSFRFYAKYGRTLAAKTYLDGFVEDGGLWEETWPQSGVSSRAPDASFTASAAPNPATGRVTLSFSLSEPGEVSVTVLNVLGEVVRELPSPHPLPKGEGEMQVDLSKLPAGIYYARIVAGKNASATMVKLVKE